MKKLLTAAAIAAMLSTGACDILFPTESSNDEALILAALMANSQAVGTLEGTVTGTRTLGSQTLVKGTVFVASGAKLIVPAGAKVYGDTGSSIFVLAGGQIEAVGTASNPVVFTSAKAEGKRAPGDWGGIVLIGNAANNRATTATTEGTTPQNYGGCAPSSTCTAADNSGTLQYVRIEFAGNEVAPGDELNCLSLYTVGSGTTIDHVQCHMGKDDAYEFFGGTVNVKYLLATGTGDDDFDIDEGYTGKMQFLIAQKYTAAQGASLSADPHGGEMDGSPSGAAPATNSTMSNPIMKNFTFVGVSSGGNYHIRWREGITGTFHNGVLYGHANGLRCDANAGGGTQTNPTTASLMVQGNTDSNGATCTLNKLGANITASPFTSDGDPSTNTAPDYQPTATVTGQNTNAQSVSADGFFTANQIMGGMVSGDNWTSGWTYYKNN